jgi:hypothetical protein
MSRPADVSVRRVADAEALARAGAGQEERG